MPSTAGVVASSYSDLGTTYSLLRSAPLWLDAKRSPIQYGYWYNLGTGGTALNARFGAVITADTYDPLVLRYTGSTYMYIPESPVIGANYTTSTNAALDAVVGDIEFVFRYRLDGFSGALDNLLISRGYAGQFFIKVSPGSYMLSNIIQGVRQDVPLSAPLVLGQTIWAKITRSASTGLIEVYHSTDKDTEPTSWNFIRSVTGATGNLTPSNVDIQIGKGSIGAYYRVIVRSGIGQGATTVFDADFTKGIASAGQSSFLESSPSAVTVTPLRDTTGRKTCLVTNDVLLMGTDDYLEILDNDLIDFSSTDDLTILVMARTWSSIGAFTKFLIKQTPASPTGSKGYDLRINAAYPSVSGAFGDGTAAGNFNNFSASANLTSGLMSVIGVKREGGSSTTLINNSTSNTVTGYGYDMRNSASLLIGSGAMDMELSGVAIFRCALSASEIAAIVSYYGAG